MSLTHGWESDGSVVSSIPAPPGRLPARSSTRGPASRAGSASPRYHANAPATADFAADIMAVRPNGSIATCFA